MRRFIQRHRGAIHGFLAGTTADPTTSDFYGFIKDQLSMRPLAPPVPGHGPEDESIHHSGYDFAGRRDYVSATRVIPTFRALMSPTEVVRIMGWPNAATRTPTTELGYYSLTYHYQGVPPKGMLGFAYMDPMLTFGYAEALYEVKLLLIKQGG